MPTGGRGSSRTGVESEAVTRHVRSAFSIIRMARLGSAPGGSDSRGRRTISVKRVVPFRRSTVPSAESVSAVKASPEARATTWSVKRKQVSTAAKSRCSGLHASPGPSNSTGGADLTSGAPPTDRVAAPAGPPVS